jgi:hypothetical protein
VVELKLPICFSTLKSASGTGSIPVRRKIQILFELLQSLIQILFELLQSLIQILFELLQSLLVLFLLGKGGEETCGEKKVVGRSVRTTGDGRVSPFLWGAV